jgi:hypothetical protein
VNRKSFEIKLVKSSKDLPLHYPIEITEEFYLGKNISPIHHWFIEYAEKTWHIKDDHNIIDEEWANNITVHIGDLAELLKTIKLVIENPKLGKELLPYPNNKGKLPYIDDKDRNHLDDIFYDDSYLNMLEFVGEQLEELIEDDKRLPLIDDYRYGAG